MKRLILRIECILSERFYYYLQIIQAVQEERIAYFLKSDLPGIRILCLAQVDHSFYDKWGSDTSKILNGQPLFGFQMVQVLNSMYFGMLGP